MNGDRKSDAETATGIVRVRATPQVDEQRGLAKDTASRWDGFKSWLGPVLKVGESLAKRFARARVSKENNQAKRIAAEACEIAARTELLQAQVRIAKQDELSKNIDNLDAMSKLPPAQQVFAMAKMIEQDPAILEQVEKVQSLLGELSLVKGLSISPLPDGVAAIEAAPVATTTQAKRKPGRKKSASKDASSSPPPPASA